MTEGVEGLDTGHIKPCCFVASSASEPRYSSHSPWSSWRGTSAQALSEASVWTSRRCRTRAVSQLSAIPCRKGSRPGALILARGSCKPVDRLCPLFTPQTPAWLHWFVLIPFREESTELPSVKHLSYWGSLMPTNASLSHKRTPHGTDCQYPTIIGLTQRKQKAFFQLFAGGDFYFFSKVFWKVFF